MTDVLTPKQRSHNMSMIHSKNTRPELAVRYMLSKLGYKYRLHVKKIPGKPDIVLTKLKKVIFINGCYWHMHRCKYGKVVPKTNADFWEKKRLANKERDLKNYTQLKSSGWKWLIIWECELKNNKDKVLKRLIKYIS